MPGFLARYPDIQLEVVAESNVQDIFRDGCDAGIRYDDHLEQDMVALPIGPRVQRFAAAASSAYLTQFGTPQHPRELLHHRCLYGRYATGVIADWEFEKGEEVVRLQPKGPLICSIGAAMDLTVAAAISGAGVVYLFEDWIKPALDNGSLQPILSDWWQSFSGLWLYYNDRRLIPAPLQAFLDYVRELTRSRRRVNQQSGHQYAKRINRARKRSHRLAGGGNPQRGIQGGTVHQMSRRFSIHWLHCAFCNQRREHVCRGAQTGSLIGPL